MTKMKDLFGDTPYQPYGGDPPSQKHSSTSKAAASSIKKKIGPLHRRVMAYLLANPQGASDERMMDDLHLGGNTLRPRRRELQLMGYVEDSGRTVLTRSRRLAVVWVLAKAST